jgi:tetratricopeptide (TPR) repeat protein
MPRLAVLIRITAVAAAILCAPLLQPTGRAQTSTKEKIHRLLEEVAARPDNAILRNNLAVAYANRASELYEQGEIEAAITALDDAVSQFDIALKIIPSDTSIAENYAKTCLNLGELHRSRKHFKSAESYYAQSAQIFEKAGDLKQSAQAQIRLARLYYYAMNDLSMAQTLLINIITSKKAALDSTTLAEVYVDLANTYIASNDMEKAKDALIESINVSRQHVPSHVMLGQVYYWLGNKEKGLNELLLAEQCALSPSDINVVGSAYRDLGLCDHAIRLFTKALDNASGKARVHAYVGLGHCSKGESRIRYFEHAVSLDQGNDPDLFCVRGKLCFSRYEKGKNLKDLREAIEWYQKAIAYRPNIATYHNDLGVAYLSLYGETCDKNVLESMIEEYKRARDLHSGPLDPILLSNLAQGYLAYAVAEFNGCDDIRNDTYHYVLRRVAETQSVPPEVTRNIEQALSYYERVITLSPENRESYEQLRSIYHALNREDAVKRLEARAQKSGISLSPIE